jgi:hypothetical protein
MNKSIEIDKIINRYKRELLVNNSVDSWEWYDESLNSYVPSTDRDEDNLSWLNALEFGGLDNWDWHGEALEGLDEYEDYLEEADDLDAALDFYAWKKQTEEVEAAAKAVEAAVKAAEAAAEAPVGPAPITFSGDAEKTLYAKIQEKFGTEKADNVFREVQSRNSSTSVWSQFVFPKEFKNAIKVVQEGVENPLELARQRMLASLIKNGKLDIYLNDFGK